MNRIWLRLWLAILAAFWGLLIFSEIASLPTTLGAQLLSNDNETLLLVVDGLGTLLYTTLFAALLAWYLARPLVALSNAARQVAEGDLSARVGIQKRPLGLQSGEVNRLLYDFNAMATSLERLETERLATTAAIAHELRTPIAVLRARLAALRDGVFELDKDELPLLIQQTDLLARLVDDLRYLSLAEAGKLELNLAPCDVSVLVKEVAESFEPRAAAQDVKLDTTLESAVVVCDEVRLRQVVSNLLDNALKFTPRAGTLTLTTKASPKGATLSVRDTGPGFAEGEEKRVFERFHHGESSSGSGLGLAIVKTLVELHGGRVEAMNVPEGGALVRLFLPAQPPTP